MTSEERLQFEKLSRRERLEFILSRRTEDEDFRDYLLAECDGVLDEMSEPCKKRLVSLYRHIWNEQSRRFTSYIRTTEQTVRDGGIPSLRPAAINERAEEFGFRLLKHSGGFSYSDLWKISRGYGYRHQTQFGRDLKRLVDNGALVKDEGLTHKPCRGRTLKVDSEMKRGRPRKADYIVDIIGLVPRAKWDKTKSAETEMIRKSIRLEIQNASLYYLPEDRDIDFLKVDLLNEMAPHIRRLRHILVNSLQSSSGPLSLVISTFPVQDSAPPPDPSTSESHD